MMVVISTSLISFFGSYRCLNLNIEHLTNFIFLNDSVSDVDLDFKDTLVHHLSVIIHIQTPCSIKAS